MVLKRDAALEQARVLLNVQKQEREKLDVIRKYWKGKQDLPAVVPRSVPREVRTLAKIARVNVCDVVVESVAQSLFVDGMRAGREADNISAWTIWQLNKFDPRQAGVHRAALAYHTAYVIVVPGEPVPVIRGASPRRMTTLYGEDPDWPVWAFESWGGGTYRLYDDEAVYYFSKGEHEEMKFLEAREHEMDVCPVVRFRNVEDLDAEDDIEEAREELLLGEIAPLKNLQDQIDITSFNLLLAQHYQAFRQRYIIGWTAKSEEQKAKAAASQLWTFDENPEDLKIGEFGQVDLKGYIDSRGEMTKYAATLSQTPVHELIGELVNLSAEALAAAEAGRDRKVDERKTSFGESWEQVLRLASRVEGADVPDDAQVRWRDTSARAFGAVIDGLGKMATMLGIPPRGLWEQIPGVTDQDIKSWEALAEQGDAFGNLERMLAQQAAGGEGE